MDSFSKDTKTWNQVMYRGIRLEEQGEKMDLSLLVIREMWCNYKGI